MVETVEANYKFFIGNELLAWLDKFLHLGLAKGWNILVVPHVVSIGKHIKRVYY